MEIIPDPIHVALLTLPFLVAAISMHVILWRPLLDWLEERDALSASAYKQAEELDQSAEDHIAKIEARLLDARAEVGAIRQAARTRALGREGEIVGAARTAAESQIGDAVGRIQAEQEAARTALRASTQELSNHIAARVLGREIH